MKNIKLIIYSAIVALLLPVYSCRDESLYPIPEYETAVHGFARIKQGSATTFFFGENTGKIDMELQWVSIDQKNTVTKIEVFINFRESYLDQEGNPRVANHGTKKLLTIEGSNVPANRTFTGFSVTAEQIYNLYRDAQFNYGDGNGSVPVFNNTFKPDRTPNSRFTPDDTFTVTWAFTTADGRYFDSWSDSVCSEFPGANCQIRWGVVCVSDLAGTFNYVSTELVRGPGGTACGGPITGQVTWTLVSAGKYSTTDASFGQFGECWGDDPANSPTFRINDVCNKISTEGRDQYGDAYTYTIQNVDGPNLTIRWRNTYGDGGLVVLTRTDGRNWPPLRN